MDLTTIVGWKYGMGCTILNENGAEVYDLDSYMFSKNLFSVLGLGSCLGVLLICYTAGTKSGRRKILSKFGINPATIWWSTWNERNARISENRKESIIIVKY